jgi:hypothetical protein
MLRLHVRFLSHVTLAAYGAGRPAVMRQVSQSRRDILSQTLLRGLGAGCRASFRSPPKRSGVNLTRAQLPSMGERRSSGSGFLV